MTDTATADDEATPVDDPQPGDESVEHETPAVEVVDDAPAGPGVALALVRGPLVPGRDVPIIPGHQEMQGLAAMAVTLAGADAVPAALRGKPNDVFQILLTARDLGVSVTAGLREFHVIDGKVTLSPKIKLAMVNERGRAEGWAVWPDTENDGTSATWYATRADRPGLVFHSTFTMEDAARIPTREKGKDITFDQKSNYLAHPKRMLSWRALGYLMDDVFPEVGTGLYSPDEMGAMTDEEGNVIDVSSTEPLPGTKAPRGHGPKEADPGDDLLADASEQVNPELLAAKVEIRSRVDRLRLNAPEAVRALVDLWGEKFDDGSRKTPSIDYLARRHLIRVRAMLDSIESRLRRGEWGSDALDAWTAADPSPENTPDGPQTVPAAGSDEETPTGQEEQGAETGDGSVDPEPVDPPTRDEIEARIVAETVEEVRKMRLPKVLSELNDRDLDPDVEPKLSRDRLAAVLTGERLAALEAADPTYEHPLEGDEGIPTGTITMAEALDGRSIVDVLTADGTLPLDGEA